MATTETTTLRVPSSLRDEIARLAEERGTTMLVVVSDAVDRLRDDQWWEAVHVSLGDLSDQDLEARRAEVQGLDGAVTDGLDHS